MRNRASSNENQVYSRGACGGETVSADEPPKYIMFVRTQIPELPWRLVGFGNDIYALSDGLGGIRELEGYVMRTVPVIHQMTDGTREYLEDEIQNCV